jgi:hypothetical protein
MPRKMMDRHAVKKERGEEKGEMKQRYSRHLP